MFFHGESILQPTLLRLCQQLKTNPRRAFKSQTIAEALSSQSDAEKSENASNSDGDREDSPWRFEPGEVYYGDTEILVTGIPRRLLESLARAQRPLSRESLEDAGWPDGQVEPGTLDKQLTDLRKSLRKALAMPDSHNPIPCQGRREHAAWKLDFRRIEDVSQM